ncbi:hypothetical protein RHGRI_005077 [Rhododendron griersonianum]|uniref:Ubiquitin-like protease family profile domain-containing protein n=1 Tax=Rhododendron griersonianum TaxID=479676 RepID=A0AAV6LBW6_9ERIC|nr:hypothetical protein RHGRI_005077 [Rhododendron griersonianum]
MTGETPAIEKQSGFYLDSALQKENEDATCRSRELVEQIDEERGLKEEQMEKNKELVKQMEELKCEVVKQQEENAAKIAELEKHKAVMNKENADLVIQIEKERALKEDEIKELKSIIETKNEAATCRSRELVEQIDEERGLKEKQMEKNKELVKQMEELKCEVVKQQEENAAKIAELVEQIDEERGLKEEQMEKNKELVKQMEELKCEVVKQQEKNAAKIAEFEKHKAVMNKENADLVIQIEEDRVLKKDEIKELKSIIEEKDQKKAAELNVQSFKDYEPPIALQQTTNVEHEEHSNDQEKDMDVIDFIPEQYRDMVRTILKDGSSIRVWAAEDIGCFVFDDDFRFLVLNEALTSGANQIANDINTLMVEGTVRMTNKVRTVTNTPQQHPESVDCGVIVCYLMNRISRNKEIDPKLSQEQCIRFRAKMAVKLLTDTPRSWSPEDNEDDDFDI